MEQIAINFNAGLTDQFPEWTDVVRASVYGCGKPFKVIAADLDMSSSELSRKLANNPNDNVHFPCDRLPDLIRSTGDLRPVYWLIETFCETPDRKRERVMAQVDEASKALTAALAQWEAMNG